MAKVSKIALFISMLATSAAYAQAPGETEVSEPESFVETPAVAPQATVRKPIHDPLATTRPWGFGVRATGLSGIGALPGVNYGGELAANLRHQELFAELAIARWKPEHTYVVTESPEHVELGLNCWTVRAGWAGMKMPLRAWVLTEVGELASAKQMPGVVPRMMMGSTPMDRRWKAVGAGFGVAWPMNDTARLFGMVEFAVPVNRDDVQLDGYGTYEPDPLAARSSVGLELGWR
ncbi:MAG TPA: hypothetical protein VL326_17480 [Kofleriaceae bacterium]|nr:hypothetical protein [Kofleriaceae bacterium]